jgi:hypothetical protein
VLELVSLYLRYLFCSVATDLTLPKRFLGDYQFAAELLAINVRLSHSVCFSSFKLPDASTSDKREMARVLLKRQEEIMVRAYYRHKKN